MTHARCLGLLIALIAGILFTPSAEVSAEAALGLQPLQYQETLKKGEVKKAYIDVTNPSGQSVTTSFSVQGFKQVDDKGNLAFYDDQRLREGIRLDYDEVEIPARKTLRLYFIVDGSKLPRGDVFAVIFATTKPEQGAVSPSVRLGTLLILANETPGARQASIELLHMPLVQIGESLNGEVKVKNTAPANTASGFFPEIKLSTWPFGPVHTIKAPLVYAGNTRTVTINKESNLFGIFKVTASHGESRKDAWIILVTGVWRWVSIVLVVIVAVLVVGLVWWRRHKSRRHG